MLLDSQIEAWFAEDVGHHDVTNDVPGDAAGRLVATESGTVAGLDAAVAAFDYVDVDATATVENGATVDAGDVVLRAEGPARDVLRAERVAVNVAGHASGVATRTAAAVDAARDVDDRVRVACTRKTTPGLRGVEKRAVAAAGGDTHRLDLSHMVMVKDNHIAAMGLEDAVRTMAERASFTTKVEVEVERGEDAPRAAVAGADVVLLDNMGPDLVADAVDRLAETGHDDVLVEASGGITLADVPAYAETGVDVVSMGSLTHSAPALDLSFRLE